MKKFVYKSSRTKSFFLIVLSLLGLSSCDYFENIFNPKCMYGSPTIDYNMHGNVKNETGSAISGIKIVFNRVIQTDANGEYVYPCDSLFTNSSGNYSFTYKGLADSFRLVAKDIDGIENGGEFNEVIINVADKDFIRNKDGDGSWYLGTADLEKNLVMKKKTDE